MAIKRLRSLFEQYAPGDITQSMRSQFEALNSLVSDSVRQGESDTVQKGNTPDAPFASREASLLDEVERAKASDERDQIYFKLATLMLKKEDAKARDYVGKIEESGFRKQAQAWVDWALAVNAIRKKKTEMALDLNRTGELTHIQRVWILTQAAKLLVQADHPRASSLLDAATDEAGRIDGRDLDRTRPSDLRSSRA